MVVSTLDPNSPFVADEPNLVASMDLIIRIGVAAVVWLALYAFAQLLPENFFLRGQVLRFLAILIAILIIGPETGLGAEVFAALDVLGAELFLASLIVGLRILPIWLVVYQFKKLLERIDPWFLLPSIGQIRECPPIIVHAIPFFLLLFLAVALWEAPKFSA